MPIDPSIPLGVSNSVIDPSQGLNALAQAFQFRKQKKEQAAEKAERDKDRAQERELRAMQIANEKFKSLDDREQRRLRSTIIGAAQLDGYLQSGNLEGAKSFLQSRRQTIEQAKTIDPSLDTTETDDAIQMVESGNIDELKEITRNSIKLGQALKFLDKPEGQSGFTLSPGQVRYGPDGKILAEAPDEPKATELSPSDIKNLGLPRGTVAQRKPDGSLSIVFKPEQDSTGNIRAQKIRNLVSQGMEQNDAANIVDGIVKIEIVPETGNARLVNLRDKSVKEIPIGGDSPTRATIPSEQQLFNLVEDATGLQSAALSVTARVPGTKTTPTEEKVLHARNQFKMFGNEVARALVNNPRFPISEREAVLGAIDISPEVFDTPSAMRIRLQSSRGFLETKFNQATRDAKDTSLPEDIRSAQAQNAATIRNAIDRIGSQNVDINKEIGSMTPKQLRDMIKNMSIEELNAMDSKTRSRIAEALK